MAALYTGAEALKAAGFRQTDISVLYSDRSAVGPNSPFAGLLAYLAGIGAVSFPGVGPFLAAGPLSSVFGHLGVAARGLLHSLVGLGLPEGQAQQYAGGLEDGRLMMSVHCDDDEWAGRASDILQQTGAEDVATAPDTAAVYQS
jgi:hypothetical protein